MSDGLVDEAVVRAYCALADVLTLAIDAGLPSVEMAARTAIGALPLTTCQAAGCPCLPALGEAFCEGHLDAVPTSPALRAVLTQPPVAH